VDDEEQILSALRRCLRREGYELLTATNPGAGLSVLKARHVDAILSDHKMPGMTGIQFLEQAAILQPEAVLMLITGWTEEIPPERLKELGIRAIVSKPWDDARLKATLRKVLDPARVASSERGDSDSRDLSSDYSWLR
jgi:response regulator RpfG family c-di-GMP phosphodiesterase